MSDFLAGDSGRYMAENFDCQWSSALSFSLSRALSRLWISWNWFRTEELNDTLMIVPRIA